jgi:hypothetical protein
MKLRTVKTTRRLRMAVAGAGVLALWASLLGLAPTAPSSMW